MAKIQLLRSVRTSSSELYYLWLNHNQDSSDGIISMHFDGSTYYAIVILLRKARKRILDEIINKINELAPSPYEFRDDLIIHVFQGSDLGMFSDHIPPEVRSQEPATQADIGILRKQLENSVSRHNETRGKLTEHAVCEFLRKLNYNARLSDPELDKDGVDVIAEGDNHFIYGSVKNGQIAQAEIWRLVRFVQKVKLNDSKDAIAGIFASSLPPDIEITRLRIEEDMGVRMICLTTNQVLNIVRDHKRFLS